MGLFFLSFFNFIFYSLLHVFSLAYFGGCHLPFAAFYIVPCLHPHFLEVVALHMASSCPTQCNSISAILLRFKLQFLPSRPKGKPIGKNWWADTLPFSLLLWDSDLAH